MWQNFCGNVKLAIKTSFIPKKSNTQSYYLKDIDA